ncbi:efflux RND transporter periplasmic adaptor subunit [Halomonas denitrificans]|nr:efflux RND transporter periplasmic adaptor subunit [Halomonas denitrificans]
MTARVPPIADRPTSSFHSKPIASAVLSIALLTALLAAAGCSESEEPQAAASPPPRPVEAAPVIEVPAVETIRFPGVTRATRRATLSFLQAGTLAERRVERGDAVEAGQLLAVLDNPRLQPGVAAARGALAEAETRLAQLERDTERQARLVERELVAADDLEQVRAQRDAAAAARDQARARLDEAIAQLDEAALRAPFAGRIAETHLEPGDFAAAGQAIVDLVDTTALEIEVRLPAQRASGLRTELPGRAVRRVTDGATTDARLASLGRASPGRTAPAVFTLVGADGFAPGDPVEISLDFAARPGMAVPLSAVVNPGTAIHRVFRVRDGRAESVAVQVGRLQGRHVTVFGDLAPGDRVIVSGQSQLLDGEPVRVLP